MVMAYKHMNLPLANMQCDGPHGKELHMQSLRRDALVTHLISYGRF